MFTLLAIANFFDDFLKTFEGYNFVDKYIYSPEMDFSKLKPYILNTQDVKNRTDNWVGIIFNHGAKRRGDIYYHSTRVMGEVDTSSDVYKRDFYYCQYASNDLGFNLVSNDIYTLEALENEVIYFYNGLKGYANPLPKLPNLQGFCHDITLGELTKYSSKEYGELCSLGFSCILNYPVLLSSNIQPIIKTIKLLIGNKIRGESTDSIFYQKDIIAEE